MDRESWLANVDLQPSVRVRLLCFAHAGGGATPFFRWGSMMPEGVSVCPVRRPGRESTHAEPLLRDIGALAAGTLQAMERLPPRPTVLFGHSVGGLLAYEVARRMQAMGAAPALLIVSAKPPPQVPATRADLGHLGDAQFLDAVDRIYGGIPKELKAAPELLQMLLPIIRADIVASEAYRHTAGPRLRCPIVVCFGADDRAVDPAGLSAWGELTEGGLEVRGFPGGHFFVYEPGSGFLAAVRELLAPLAASGGAVTPARRPG